MTLTKNKSKLNPVACAVLVASIACMPIVVNAQNVENDQSGGKGGWLALTLLPKVSEALVSVITTAFSSGASCVFSNLFSFMGAVENPNCKPKTDPATINNVPNNGTVSLTTATPTAPTAPVVTTAQAEGLAAQPIFAFVIKKLANNAPNALDIGEISSGKFVKDENPNFKIRTGEAFAIAFSTTVPGRVRLINTDADQISTESALYETLPGADNRMPRLHEGGILMSGKPGFESLDVIFTPCISPTYSRDSRVIPFINQLDPCTTESAEKQYKPSKGGISNFIGKAMVFPANADPSKPVALAPTNYSKGELLRFRIMIEHVAN